MKELGLELGWRSHAELDVKPPLVEFIWVIRVKRWGTAVLSLPRSTIPLDTGLGR